MNTQPFNHGDQHLAGLFWKGSLDFNFVSTPPIGIGYFVKFEKEVVNHSVAPDRNQVPDVDKGKGLKVPPESIYRTNLKAGQFLWSLKGSLQKIGVEARFHLERIEVARMPVFFAP